MSNDPLGGLTPEMIQLLLGGNRYLPNEEEYGALPGDYTPHTSKGVTSYTAQPDSITTRAKKGNYVQDQAQMVADPILSYIASIIGGGSALDYNQFGGSGYTAQTPYSTPVLDTYSKSTDPMLAAAAAAIKGGTGDPVTIKAQIAAKAPDLVDQVTGELKASYSGAIDKMFEEHNAQTIDETKQAGTLNPLQKRFADAGLGDPTQQYTATTLPRDVAPSGLQPFDSSGYDSEIAQLQREAKSMGQNQWMQQNPTMPGAVAEQPQALAAAPAEPNGYQPFNRGDVSAPKPPGDSSNRWLVPPHDTYNNPGPRGTVQVTHVPGVPNPNYSGQAPADGGSGGGGVLSLLDNPQIRNRFVGTDAERETTRQQASGMDQTWTQPAGTWANRSSQLYTGKAAPDQRMHGNKAAADLQIVKGQRDRAQLGAQQDEDAYNQVSAQLLGKRGRTPSGDMLRARLAQLRALGMGI